MTRRYEPDWTAPVGGGYAPVPERRELVHGVEDARVTEKAGRTLLVSALVGWGVNIVALLVVDWIFDSVEIGRWGSILIGAAVLGLGNAIVKPVLALLTLPLILVTLGLSYFALNVLMLALAEWIAPDFSIDGFWTYVGATIIVWLVNWILNALLPDVD
jgi:putative membrane protein